MSILIDNNTKEMLACLYLPLPPTHTLTKQPVLKFPITVSYHALVNALTPKLNPSMQRCLTRYFTADFAS
jgi:hypothetical protein